ncbi:glycosyltransferase family 2 protein [Flavisericum labens]|uniref:glycosyltransferase family 2 protein n=1 Tax=Flavisericum labens TaxID=3377112 RepID=UPI00387B805F
MLSILIPTYNYNVYPLVCQLEKQASEANAVFEIICIDDGSNSESNRENNKINTLSSSRFIANTENLGLSNNRNLLASKSKYENLLFIDGDSLLPNNDFIKNYLEALKQKTQVVYGGRVHPETVEPSRKLRWKYGRFREDQSAVQRNKNKYKCTLFNNTLVKKVLFEKIGFEKKITEYGHEDTIFAYELSLRKARILHIDNPVLHGDVDYNETYFIKTKKGLQNLNYIYKAQLVDPSFITFLVYFEKIKKAKMNYVLSFFYKSFSGLLRKNLISNQPSLLVFDIFRLSYFCSINLRK